ncbi:MAG: ribonuclease III, partial [Bacteroidales bacterium]|nr:ribonuclease III [Bacteroidales bacterium]
MNLLDRMKFPFRRNKEFLSALYDILGFYPHNIDIYRLAFAHKSMSGRRQAEAAPSRDRRRRGARPEQPAKPLNNERLEYLGDAVLETVVSDIVFHHFPTRREGFLTATRSKIVQRESLNRLAAEMGLERLIQASQGTHLAHTNIGGNAFEALMGAIYLDRGFKHCYWFIAHRVIGHYIDLDTVADKEVNFKSKLLEW